MRKLLIIITLALAPLWVWGQRVTVKGTVTDAEDGSPLPGVVVMQKGGGVSATTDLDGHYSIGVPADATLTFSLLGMLEREVLVNGRSEIDIQMSPDVNQLEDVLVVAYGTSTKESFTGSAEVVSSAKLKDMPVSNVSKMLDGQVAGVMTTSGSGQPGSGASILIRGFGSINASSSPLIVVDGVPFDGSLSSLNANDIESITVLKDASAGALYGARGANGVVMVTTRTGASEQDALSIDFSARVGVNSRALPFYETLSASEYMEQMYRASYNDLVYTEGYLPSVAKGMTVDRLARNILGNDNVYNIYDRQPSELFDEDGKLVPGLKQKWDENWIEAASARFPVRQEYQFSVSGASKVSKYMASLGMLDEKGTLQTTGFKRYSARLNSDFTPFDWLEFGLGANYTRTRSDFLGSTGTTNTNVWYSAMMMAPIYPVYMKNPDGTDCLENGQKVFDYGASRPAGAQNNRNSVATLFDDDYYTLQDNIDIRTRLALNLGPFKLSTSLGADTVSEFDTTNYNRHSGNAAGTGRLTKEHKSMVSYTWNQLLSFNKKFSGHAIDAMAGHEFYSYNLRYLMAERTGFPFDNYDELGMGSTIADGYSESESYAIDSYLFRTNYSYADKYYTSVSLRTDASSRFKKEHRWGKFWSVGASWRISQEDFLADRSWINNITLKASYGVQGNDNIGSYYAWQSLYDMNYPNATNSGAIIASIESQDVTWEKNGNLNAGLEFRLLGALSGTIEWYSRKTTDLLLEYPMAISLGFPGYYANVGSMVNRGFDITVGYDIVNRPEAFWNVSLMASTVRNKVLSLVSDDADITNGIYLLRVGEPINTFYVARSAGVDPANGDQLYLAYKKDESGKRIEGSEYVTNNPTVASGSKWMCGNRIPDVYGSLSTSARFRGLDFSLMLTYSLGGKIYDGTYSSLMEPSFVGQTYHKNSLRAWTEPGQVTDVPKVTTTTTTISSDRFLVDASYLAFKSCSLGYTFDSSLLRRCNIKSLRLYAAAENIWLFTGMQGLNPQASFSGSTSYTYTPNRTVSVGIDLKF